MTVTINNKTFEVSNDIAKAIEALCTINGKEIKAKATAKATAKEEPKKYDLPYTVNGNTVTVGGKDNYIPKKVFYALTHTIKDNGGTWDKDKKVWVFKDKKSVTAFEKKWAEGSK